MFKSKLGWRRRKEAKPEGIPEIIISSQSNLSRDEEFPVLATLLERNPEDRRSAAFKRKLCIYAQKDMWSQSESVFHTFPDMLRIPLTFGGDTALHVAVYAKSVNFVNGLFNLMSPGDLEIQNSSRNNAFCMAAISGNVNFLKIMIEINQNLPMIEGRDRMLPFELAVFSGQHKVVQYLTSDGLLQKMEFEDIKRLFFMSIKKGMFDVAINLFEKYPTELTLARDDKDLTALHMLLEQRPSEKCPDELSFEEYENPAMHMPMLNRSEELYLMKEDKNEGLGLLLLKKVWRQVREMEPDTILDLITRPSTLLFDAVKSGNSEIVEWLLPENVDGLLNLTDGSSGENILHIAVKYRQSSIFDLILSIGSANQLLQAVDKESNNVLHFAAYPQEKEQESTSLTPTTKITRNLAWFKEVQKKVPPELRTMRNLDGKSPKDVFYDSHKKLSKEVKDSGKGIAESGMLVAALVVTVAFAAAVTVPGDKTSAWFTVFILANAAALFTSSASLLCFLLNFTTSRFSQSEFVISLHPTLIYGLNFLLASFETMVIAFAAAAFLIFEHRTKWVAYVVASMGTVPLLVLRLLQLSYFDHLWSRFYLASKL